MLRRGEQQVSPSAPRQLPPARQRRYATGIDELQPGQIDDDLRGAGGAFTSSGTR
jgi:hypothetical protein